MSIASATLTGHIRASKKDQAGARLALHYAYRSCEVRRRVLTASWLLRAKTLPPRQARGDACPPRSRQQPDGGTGSAGDGARSAGWFWQDDPSCRVAQRNFWPNSARVAWLTLDADDSGDRLVAYVAFALQEAGVDMSADGDSRSGWRTGAPTGAAALHAVLNAVAAFGRRYLPDFRRCRAHRRRRCVAAPRQRHSICAGEPAHRHRHARQSRACRLPICPSEVLSIASMRRSCASRRLK